MSPQKLSFPQSKKLQKFFNEQVEIWKKKTRLGISDLSERVGVSQSYLSHVGRYGRIPAKPVLILLAFNFGLKHPQEIFELADIKEPWPYDPNIGLSDVTSSDGFLSVKFNVQEFSDTIRKIVRSEVGPRSIRDLTQGRALRIGYNLFQKAFFDFDEQGVVLAGAGFFPKFIKLLSNSLQCEITLVPTHYEQFSQKLQDGVIDLFGPVFTSPLRIGAAIFTDSFCQVGISALYRKTYSNKIKELPAPKTLSNLKQNDYQFAVLKNSQAHHYVSVQLAVPDERILVCESADEVLERVLMAGVSRPAHIMICDSYMAKTISKEHKGALDLLFATSDSILEYYDDSLAIRPDWPEMLGFFNQSLGFLLRNNTLSELLKDNINEDYLETIKFPRSKAQ